MLQQQRLLCWGRVQLTTEAVVQLLYRVACGVEALLVRARTVHRDIRAANVLLRSATELQVCVVMLCCGKSGSSGTVHPSFCARLQVCVADFGLSCNVDKAWYTVDRRGGGPLLAGLQHPDAIRSRVGPRRSIAPEVFYEYLTASTARRYVRRP